MSTTSRGIEPRGYEANWRDRMVRRACNALLLLATPEYRAFVALSVLRGKRVILADLIRQEVDHEHN